jgi:pyruvate ferredoxin oxidoreductase gamma subunit
VTLAELVALAAIKEGKYAQSMPSFGPERRGAPVFAYIRISDEIIRIRGEIKNPDAFVVLDATLLNVTDVSAGLKEGGVVIINTKKSAEEMKQKNNCKIGVVDASNIAKEVLDRDIVNTTMIGALIRATQLVRLEGLEEPMKERFGALAAKNIKAMKRAYEETQIK